MSDRFRIELTCWSICLTWLVVGVVMLVVSEWYWFVLLWVMVAFCSAYLEYRKWHRQVRVHWKKIPLFFNFLVHFSTPVLTLITLPRLPSDYRHWKATPKPRHKNFDWGNGRG
jgi:hypothetical protein